jgi:hypothetical protein
MSKARIIGAGLAGSTNYNTNVNLDTAGGTKKQGYPSAVANIVNNREINTRARGENNDIIFPMNQLQGGVHKPIRNKDGATSFLPYNYYGPRHIPQYSGGYNSFLVSKGPNAPPAWEYPFRAGFVVTSPGTGTVKFQLNNVNTPFVVGTEVLVNITPIGTGTGVVNITAQATRHGFSWVASGGIGGFYYLAVGQKPEGAFIL